jgi:AraC-like DNA-binding protein
VADSAFLNVPGQWHRFCPDPKTGWTETWIEFQGLVPNALCDAGQLGGALVVRVGVEAVGLWVAMDSVLQRVHSTLPGVNPTLSALALEALAAWTRVCQTGKPNPDGTQALSAAVDTLNRQYRTAIDLKALAKDVGISYSVFRHAFRKHTGFAPWQYVRHLRLVNTRHRLATSADSLTDLADDLGFSSPFHLSSAFRKEFGHSPT